MRSDSSPGDLSTVAEPAQAPGADGGGIRARVQYVTAAGAIATVGLLRMARGYRSFPSIDDLGYIPMAWSRLEPHLYTRDTLLRETPLHLSVLPALVRLLRDTTGLELGFWLVTIALSLLTVLAMYRWVRALGLPGAFLPVAALVACAGAVQGLGRGEYDGVFGDAFHFQWAALCALVWAYDSVARSQWVRGTTLVALAVVFHPVVGIHGAVAAACGWFYVRIGHTRARRWLVPAAVVLCAAVAAVVAVRAAGPSQSEIGRLPLGVQALLFRAHEYEIVRVKSLILLVIAAAGIMGIGLVLDRCRHAASAALLGLLVGHVLLLGGYVILYEPHVLSVWSRWTIAPLQLSLSRTTPLLLALASVCAFAGLEAGFLEPPATGERLRGAAWFATRAVQVGAAVCIAIVQVQWSLSAGGLIALALFTAVSVREHVGQKVLAVLWLLVFAGSMASFVQGSKLSAAVESEPNELFRWTRSKTRTDALFIVPPGFQTFRYYAQRSVYVDFRTIPPTDVRSVELWWRRLRQVAAPDGLAFEARGWEGVPEWDRTYAGRNTPARIESLLRETGADYFVWDRQGLEMPPFIDRDRRPDPALAIAFQNARYQVYRIAK